VDAFEDALNRAGLAPYVVGGRGYWSQQQVEDALRLLGVVANPLDDELLFGALASPACGVSADALWLLRDAARHPDGGPRHVWPTVREGEWPDDLPDGDVERLEHFRRVLAELRAEAPLRPLDSLIDRVITAFGYDIAILAMRGGEQRMANLRKLMRLAAEYEEHDGRDLRGFLDFAEERTSRDEREGMAALRVEGHDGVRVMTVHAAKGLEFPVVFIAGLEEGLFPNSRALDDEKELEEERRLAYVGLTRARKRAYVSFAANRRVFNQWQAAIPSRFLRELPTEQLAESSDAGLYATYSAGHHGGLREQASGFDYESLGVTSGRRTRWRDETFDDRRAVEGDKVDLSVGQRVFHQKFGYGRILAVDGNKLDIEFEKAGAKKVLDSFIEAA
jgi:DNA helicase-2/ATP-dependent DNA helicase PcrA